jgi:hypothetical protein
MDMMMRTWQYNGTAPMADVVAWCQDTLVEHSWMYNGMEIIYFIGSDDAAWTMFKLRWL